MPDELREKAALQILVVDDEPLVRDVLKLMLEDLGYKPLEASNVKEALAHIQKGNVDLMLLDLHMGGAGGQDLLKVLARRKWRVPTLVVSAYVTVEITKDLVALGVRGIIVKPFKQERIAAEVEKALGR